MSGQDLEPDEVLLKGIFDRAATHCTITPFLQTWDKCIFRVDFSERALGEPIAPVVVRLETASQATAWQFSLIVAIQNLASEIMPELVPKVLKVGSVRDGHGRDLCFSVLDHVDGLTLDVLWGTMDKASRKKIVGEIADAMKKLQSLTVNSEKVQAVLGQAAGSQQNTPGQRPVYFGGAHTDVLTTGAALFDSIMERRKLKKEFCRVEKSSSGNCVTITPRFGDMDSTTLHQNEMRQWVEQAVLCHNDLTPRNIVLAHASHYTPGNGGKYKLAAIIDWELAGFYPAAYELQLQDTYLGCGNQFLSYYLMLKKEIKSIAPRNKAQEDLVRAMEVIFESQQRQLFQGNNIPAHIRALVFKKYHLKRDKDIYAGWKSRAEAIAGNEVDAVLRIEQDVIAEMTARRASRGRSTR